MTEQNDAPVLYTQVPAFWKRFPSFLIFPFRAAPLVITAGLALASIITVFTGGYFRGLVAIFFLRYAYAVMEHASQGNFLPHWEDITLFGNKDRRPYKQNLVFALYFIALAAIGGYAVKTSPTPLPSQAVATASAPSAQPIIPPVDTARPESHANDSQDVRAASEPDKEDDGDEDAQDANATTDAATGPHAVSTPTENQQAPAIPNADNDIDNRPAFSAANRFERFTDPNVHYPPWFYLIAILLALPIPASVMVLALEDNIWRAVNPATMLYFVRAMGKSYFLVWFCFALGLAACQLSFHVLPVSVTPFVRIPVQTFLSFYCILALYSMMGYALYQYHQELGIDVKLDPNDIDSAVGDSAQAKAPAKPVSTDPLIQKVDELEQSGKIDAAIRYAADELRFAKMHVGLNERLFQLYKTKGDTASALTQGQRTLIAMLRDNEGDQALRLLNELKAMDANFQLAPDALLPLAQTHFARREYTEAMQLIKGFDKANPGHADIPGVYLLGARLSSDYMHKNAHAINILKTVLKRFPDAAVVPEVQELLAKLEAIEVATAKG